MYKRQEFAYSKIKEAEKLGINVSDAKDLRRKALSEFDNREYERAKELAEEARRKAIERREEYNRALSLISEADLISEAESVGANMDLLKQSKQAFDNGKYKEAIKLAEEALRAMTADFISSAKSEIEEIKRSGVNVEASERLICDAESELNENLSLIHI